MDREKIIIKRCDNEFEGELIRSLLEDKGIDVELSIDKIPGNLLTKGVDVIVSIDQKEKALEILEKGLEVSADELYDEAMASDIPENDEEVSENKTVKCVNCKSSDIKKIIKPGVLIACIIIFPLLIFIPLFYLFPDNFASVFNYRCNNCSEEF